MSENAKIRAMVGGTVQSTQFGVGFTLEHNVPEIWGVITGKGPEDGPDNHYQWMQVDVDDDGSWRIMPIHEVEDGYGSAMWKDVPDIGDYLLNPAVEVNGKTAKIGDIVRLTPTRLIVDEYENVHRDWHFNVDLELRPFVLTEDLIPTGGGELDTTVKAEWLDLSFAEGPLSLDDLSVTLYPCHKSGWPSGDQFISLGIGRGQSVYFRGTYGWARWNPKATATGRDEHNAITWRGEWQIVTLYAELIAQAVVPAYEPGGGEDGGGGDILPGATGQMLLMWLSAGTMVDSGYHVNVYNDKPVPLAVGDIYKIEFNRAMYVWTPIDGPTPHGISVYASEVVSTFSTKPTASLDNVLVQVPLDVEISEARFGQDLELDAVAHEIKNVGTVDRVGVVSWHVTANRVITAADDAGDVASYCEVVLKNDGVEVIGCTGRITSSRRKDEGEGHLAVNTDGNSIVVRLKPGKALTLWIRKNLQAYEIDPITLAVTLFPNDWTTVFQMCSMTFKTQEEVYIHEEEDP